MKLAKRHPCARCEKPNAVVFAFEICSTFCVAPAALARLRARFKEAEGDPKDCWPFHSRITVHEMEQQTPRLAVWLYRKRRLDRLPNVRWCPRFSGGGRERTCVNPKHLTVTLRNDYGPTRIWTADEVVDIYTRHKQGESGRSIARSYNAYNLQISRLLKRMNDATSGSSEADLDRGDAGLAAAPGVAVSRNVT